MFHSRAEAIARVPSADAQLPTLLKGNKPVVGLPFFRCADVTRYRLPDHCISPYPHSLAAALNGTFGRLSAPHCDGNMAPQAGLAIQLDNLDTSWNSPSFISSQKRGMEVRRHWKESEDESFLNSEEVRGSDLGQAMKRHPSSGCLFCRAVTRTIAEGRSSPFWRGPGSAGRCNRDKSVETSRRI